MADGWPRRADVMFGWAVHAPQDLGGMGSDPAINQMLERNEFSSDRAWRAYELSSRDGVTDTHRLGRLTESVTN